MKNFLLGVMTTALCLVAGCPNDQAINTKAADTKAVGRKNYEYKVVHSNVGRDRLLTEEEYISEINTLARDGWKLITVIHTSNIQGDFGGLFHLYYEREKR